jgi:polyphosphate kinase
MARGMSDSYAHWRLTGDGRWTRVNFDGDGEPLADLQSAMIDMHAKRRRKARRR